MIFFIVILCAKYLKPKQVKITLSWVWSTKTLINFGLHPFCRNFHILSINNDGHERRGYRSNQKRNGLSLTDNISQKTLPTTSGRVLQLRMAVRNMGQHHRFIHVHEPIDHLQRRRHHLKISLRAYRALQNIEWLHCDILSRTLLREVRPTIDHPIFSLLGQFYRHIHVGSTQRLQRSSVCCYSHIRLVCGWLCDNNNWNLRRVMVYNSYRLRPCRNVFLINCYHILRDDRRDARLKNEAAVLYFLLLNLVILLTYLGD